MDSASDIAGHNATYSNCIFSETLAKSLHPKWSPCMAMLIDRYADRISLIGNIFAHAG